MRQETNRVKIHSEADVFNIMIVKTHVTGKCVGLFVSIGKNIINTSYFSINLMVLKMTFLYGRQSF